MEVIAIETWKKKHHQMQAEPIGETEFHITSNLHISLDSIQKKLLHSYQNEMVINIDAYPELVKVPIRCGILKDLRIKVFLRDSDKRGLFYFVGKDISNDFTIYTSAVLIDSLF